MSPITIGLISGSFIYKIYKFQKQRLLKEHAKREAEYLQKLRLVRPHVHNSLAKALQELVAQGLTNGIDNYGLFRNLEELLPLLCFDASHWRVRDSLQSAVVEVIHLQASAMKEKKQSIWRRSLPPKMFRTLTFIASIATATSMPPEDVQDDAAFLGAYMYRPEICTNKLARLLLSDPDVAEVFEGTKGVSRLWHPDPSIPIDVLERYPICPFVNDIVHRSVGPVLAVYDFSYLHPDDWPSLSSDNLLEYTLRNLGALTQLESGVYAGDPGITHVCESVEYLFNGVKLIHYMQGKLAEALLDSEGLSTSSHPVDSAKRQGKEAEANELIRRLGKTVKIVEDSVENFVATSMSQSHVCGPVRYVPFLPRYAPPRHIGEALSGRLEVSETDKIRQRNADAEWWSRGMLCLGLLAGRFNAFPAEEERREEIAKLFNAVGATDAQREDIESWVRSFHGVVHELWSEDAWIKNFSDSTSDSTRDNPFRFWDIESIRNRNLSRFLDHFNSFQFKSPRQIIEEAVLGLVQTMEEERDKVLVRDEKLEREFNKILARAVKNTGDRKIDEAIADYQTLRRRAPKNVGVLYNLAYLYAWRGENLGEAVECAQDALEIGGIPSTRQVLGWLYYQQGKVVEAIEELEGSTSAEAIAENRELRNARAFLVLGDAYRDAGRHRDAKRAWSRAWRITSEPAWKDRKELTKFQVADREEIRTELNKRFGTEEGSHVK